MSSQRFAAQVNHVTHEFRFSQRTLLQQGTPEPRKTLDIKKVSTAATSSQAPPASSIQPLSATHQRSTPPFLWSYEFARGGLFIIQSFFAYAIMLAIMWVYTGEFDASFDTILGHSTPLISLVSLLGRLSGRFCLEGLLATNLTE